MKWTLYLCLVLSLSACASAGKSGYDWQPPIEHQQTNERIVNEPFTQVWDRLVKELATSYFVINNIDKESRIINVSFYTDTPEEYLDCGTSYRTYKRGSETQQYTYKSAASTAFKAGGKWGQYKNLPVTYFISRKTSLEGRMNIYLAPHGSETLVSVNCRYILAVHITQTYEAENAFGTVMNRGSVPEKSVTCSCNTKQAGQADWGSAQEPFTVTCCSTGKLEQEILAMAQ